ncbi:hypothetical protein FF36_04518 [Frankia torreyi]|uniref:Uncharacterized protein n=1 Tax=Frankia torreyi TaxID=1856 RepID=A0A0D8BA66_9ACTN|nr:MULTISPECIES: hypothetical protein [Frankia]KJE21178.1 hypothetical protein FF36_04518 [Frankia torreyi]KQM06445.1 hypothetical protein FF86_100828 [Frankia sp. CpI1-P]
MDLTLVAGIAAPATGMVGWCAWMKVRLERERTRQRLNDGLLALGKCEIDRGEHVTVELAKALRDEQVDDPMPGITGRFAPGQRQGRRARAS